MKEKGVFQKLPRSYKGFTIAFVAASLAMSILILSLIMSNTTNVSAVEASGFGVYWNSNCSNAVSSIDWGALNPGSVKNIAVYIRNEMEKPMRLILSTANWNPPNASQYLNLRWDYTEGRRMNPGEILQITLTLSVSHYIKGISSFSFNILITGSDRLLGDANGDGVVDGLDLVMELAPAYNSHGPDIPTPGSPPSPNWNPNCDFNEDGWVDGEDMVLFFASGFNKS